MVCTWHDVPAPGDSDDGDDALPAAIAAAHRRFDVAGIYEAAAWYDVDYAGYLGEWRFYERLAATALRPGQRIVELGAGTGRLTLPLARAGYRVHGVEPADDMRRVLLDKIARDGLVEAITVEAAYGDTFVGPPGDASKARLEAEVDDVGLVIFPFNGILHVGDRGQLVRTMVRARRALGANGRFALDMTCPYWETMRRGRVPWGRVDERVHPTTGRRFLTCDRSAYDPETRVTRIDIRYATLNDDGVDDGTPGLETSLFQRMWTYPEIFSALQLAGFEVDEAFGDVDLSAFHDGAPRLLVSARPGRS